MAPGRGFGQVWNPGGARRLPLGGKLFPPKGLPAHENPPIGAPSPRDSTGIKVTLRRPASDVEKRKWAMKATELREKSVDQLRDELANLKKEVES